MVTRHTGSAIRRRIFVSGIVQGVGFRPFVYRLAHEHGLTGFVLNAGDGVTIEVQGPPASVEPFSRLLHNEAPPLARIVDVHAETVPPLDDDAFTIRDSRRDAHPVTLIAPDVATCDDCLRELFDSSDRRYRYPFINCTNCGPRYTIVERIPYDRPYTSMRVFPMCPACNREYHDPADRRFHAQPNACPVCGPQVRLRDRSGAPIDTADPIEAAVALLQDGRIVAARGIGGFHLAVDAHNDAAVRELRRRKGRAEKPFALMAPDLDAVRRFCIVDAEEEALLAHHTRPVVLLRARPGHDLAPSVAPGQRYLGFMLPYTPLHHLLLRDRFDAMVMTSGNFTEEPIAIGNAEALDRLAPLADAFLLHDRKILQRCDDSITRFVAGAVRPIRRSRGYVPAPVFLRRPVARPLLACGGELKNTIALARGDAVFLSQHVGDLDNPSALQFFEDSIAHLGQILEITPEAVAHDLHPEYLSTKWARRREDLPRIGVQHHHAHLAAVMAENGVDAPTIGLILDGTGYGTDGTIWGGEVLVGAALRFERRAWLQPFPLPGGEAAIRHPWRTALALLHAAYGSDATGLDVPPVRDRKPGEIDLLFRMIERRVNTPPTSSCGRLFDAVSALIGLCDRVNYEAQAAILLEMAVDEAALEPYPAVLNTPGRGPLPVIPLIRAIVDDVTRGAPAGVAAARFHASVAELFLTAARRARADTGIDRVGLSGGVFQNVHMFTRLHDLLHADGFTVLSHTQVPANDGGLALGQIAVAAARIDAPLI